MALVTLQEAIGQLRLQDMEMSGSPAEYTDERLPDLLLKMDAASDIVMTYLKRVETGWDEQTTPKDVKAAVLMVLESLYDDSAEGKVLAGLAGGTLNNAVVAILYRYRDPALA